MEILAFTAILIVLAIFVIYIDYDWKKQYEELNEDWCEAYDDLMNEYTKLVNALIDEDVIRIEDEAIMEAPDGENN